MHDLDDRKNITLITQECYEPYRANPGCNNLKNSKSTATNHPSQKLSKLEEPDMWDTTGEVRTNL